MRVLIFHGYLLAGTGSNVYNAKLVQALSRLGHDVHLLCQDRNARDLPWVHSVGQWHAGELKVEEVRSRGGRGLVTAYIPDIKGLLPVYVADDYMGFEVKTFPELTDAELDRYLDANVSAVRDVAQTAGYVDAALANHVVMGPAIMARAGVPFAAKVHGSALSYTVAPNPRFLPHATEGMEAARAVLVGSQHTAQALWEAVPVQGLRDKTRLGPPGVDIDEFERRERRTAVSAVASMAANLDRAREVDAPFGRDLESARTSLRRWSGSTGPRVIFVGKLIVSKGVDLLVAAWPLIARENPGATLLIAGFGSYREALEQLWSHIERGELAEARSIALRGREMEGPRGRPKPLEILAGFLDAPPEGYREAASRAAGSVVVSGRLEHDEIAEILPAADALVMPSTFPEAFGMVAAEAAACGVPPVSAAHSGMQEVSRALADAVGPELAPLLSFPVGRNSITDMAERVNGWLKVGIVDRRAAGRALSERVSELWSWEGVANGVIAASEGRLGQLPHIDAD